MKKILTIVMVLLMIFSLCACGGGGDLCLEADNVKIDAICVDDSYQDDDGSSMRMLYLFYTVAPQSENLSVSSKLVEMTVDGINEYTSEHYPDVCDYVSSYYYSDYLEDINVGESLKVVATFKVPSADLEGRKNIKISDYDIPGMDKISFTTDDIKHFSGVEAMAETVDPEGYNATKTAKEPADSATTSKVKSQIDGYFWTFYVNSTSYEIEFYSNNTYELRTAFGTTSGSYAVTKGYVVCTNGSTGAVSEIPYTFENGEIKLDVATAFDVSES